MQLQQRPKIKKVNKKIKISSKSTIRSPLTGEKNKNYQTVAKGHHHIFIMLLISLFLFGGVGTRLSYLQLIEGEKYQEKAENNRIRIIPKPPVRGNFYDRKGRILAATSLSHSAYLWPRVQKQDNWPEIRHLLATILDISETELQEKIEPGNYDSSTLVRIARYLTPEQITAIEEHRHQLPGVEVDIDTVRSYPHQELASHVLGYTREIDSQELRSLKGEGYRMGDIIGKMGAEAAFESQLRGEWGGILLEVDGAGKVQRLLGIKEALSGNNVNLTLDLDVQKSAEAALGERKGAVVALDPRDGAVLAMVSYPGFDPNIFSGRITPEIWKRVQGKGNPLVNRAFSVLI